VDLGAEAPWWGVSTVVPRREPEVGALLVLRAPREDEAAAVVEIGGVEVLVRAVHDGQREGHAPRPVDEPRDEEVVKPCPGSTVRREEERRAVGADDGRPLVSRRVHAGAEVARGAVLAGRGVE